MLNYSTLLLVLIVFTTVTSLLFIAAMMSTGALVEQRLWALGSVSASLGFAVGAMNATPVLVHAVLNYALIGLGLALVLRGLRLFFGHGLSWKWVAAITFGSVVLPGYFALVVPDKAMRVMLSGLYLGLVCWFCAYTLWRGLDDRNRGVMWASVGGFVAIGCVTFFRGLFLLALPKGTSSEQTVEALASISVLAAAVAQVMVAFGLIMLVSNRYADKLSRLTMVDGLTGALNRVGMERMGERVLMRARQSQRSVSLVMVDADFFKAINDTHGHPVGDQVLIHLANILAAQVRPGDLVIRYGGEEFVLILDGSTLDATRLVAERLRRLIEESRVSAGGVDIAYRVSIGVSCSDKAGYALDQLVTKADAALYRAKQEGRNRVCVD